MNNVYVYFSDRPLKAPEQLVALAGRTDDETDLNQLLLLMYQTWMDSVFQEGMTSEQSRIRADEPRILIPG